MKGLTKRQREFLDFIRDFIANKRYSPSYREISNHFGFNSLASVHKHIATLKKKGFLFGESKVSRAITTVNDTPPIPQSAETTIPFIGYISAGVPIQTFSETQQLQVPASYVQIPDKTYALKAKGHSLNEEMIGDGDILIIEVRHEVHPGETIVALINGHDTIVKKYYPEGDFVRLIGSYSDHAPILLRQQDVAIQAIVIGLIRFF